MNLISSLKFHKISWMDIHHIKMVSNFHITHNFFFNHEIWKQKFSKNDSKGSLDFGKGPLKLHIPIKSKTNQEKKKESKKRGNLPTYREKIKKNKIILIF